MKPGDRVIWIRSPGRTFLTDWRVERIPGVVVRVCPKRLRIRTNFWFEWLPQGDFTVRYRLRADMAGDFRATSTTLQRYLQDDGNVTYRVRRFF